MRLVSYRHEQQDCVGLVIGEQVLNAVRLLSWFGEGQTEFAANMLALLEGGEEKLTILREALVAAQQSPYPFALRTPKGETVAVPLSQVKLLPPVPNPRKVFCLAGNYEEHIREGGRRLTEAWKITPRIFMKPASNTVIAHGEPIRISKNAQFVDWEAELSVVIGRRGKYIPAEKAMDYVAGYTIFNDVSERRLLIRQRPHTEEWDRFFDWLNGKWCDSFAPMGPWLVTKDEISDPQNLRIVLKVNGEVKQDGATSQMLHTVADIINYLSQLLTLEPGDVIATGTPSGVGVHAEPPVRLKPGDKVSIEVSRIGILENPVVAE